MRLNNDRWVNNSKDWDCRRREIVEIFDREIHGHMALTARKITSNLVRDEKARAAGIPVIRR